jgi:hypothetical protein
MTEFGLTSYSTSMVMPRNDMLEILQWLFDAVQHLSEVSDAEYLLFSFILKTVFQKDQSSHEAGKTDMVAKLVEIRAQSQPHKTFVGAFLFTCHESG